MGISDAWGNKMNETTKTHFTTLDIIISGT